MLTTIMRKYRVGAIALLSLFLFAIPHSVAAQADKAEEGRKLFEQTCAKCHGADGSGNTALGRALSAKDLRSPEAQKMSDADIYIQISLGNKNMPSFRNAIEQSKEDELRAQVNDLIAYIRELPKKQTGAKKP